MNEASIDGGIDPLISKYEDYDTTDLPEELQKELRESLMTYRQNRDRLQSAVKAGGYYTGKGKSGGKKGDGKKGKPDGPRKGGGTSKADLKLVTNCRDCGEEGPLKRRPGVQAHEGEAGVQY